MKTLGDWFAAFYPKGGTVGELTANELNSVSVCLMRTIRKWDGIRPQSLDLYGMYRQNATFRDSKGAVFINGVDTCHLCAFADNQYAVYVKAIGDPSKLVNKTVENKCAFCPLTVAGYKECGGDNSPYQDWYYHKKGGDVLHAIFTSIDEEYRRNPKKFLTGCYANSIIEEVKNMETQTAIFTFKVTGKSSLSVGELHDRLDQHLQKHPMRVLLPNLEKEGFFSKPKPSDVSVEGVYAVVQNKTKKAN